jgi:hypothetical protein
MPTTLEPDSAAGRLIGVQSEHLPCTHVLSPEHFLPHIPQFFGSRSTFTHSLAQAEVPDVQLIPHWPLVQMASPPETAGQTF